MFNHFPAFKQRKELSKEIYAADDKITKTRNGAMKANVDAAKTLKDIENNLKKTQELEKKLEEFEKAKTQEMQNSTPYRTCTIL